MLNTWFIRAPAHWPRWCGVPKENRDYLDFLQRMETHLKRLKNWNVNCATHLEKEIEYLKNPQPKK
jgi:hypothetical protein